MKIVWSDVMYDEKCSDDCHRAIFTISNHIKQKSEEIMRLTNLLNDIFHDRTIALTTEISSQMKKIIEGNLNG